MGRRVAVAVGRRVLVGSAATLGVAVGVSLEPALAITGACVAEVVGEWVGDGGRGAVVAAAAAGVVAAF